MFLQAPAHEIQWAEIASNEDGAAEHLKSMPAHIRTSYVHARFSQHHTSPWASKPSWAIRVLQHSFSAARWRENATNYAAELIGYKPDILSFQNLALDHYEWISSILRQVGYTGTYLPGSRIFRASAKGLASFWRSNRFRLSGRAELSYEEEQAKETQHHAAHEGGALLLRLDQRPAAGEQPSVPADEPLATLSVANTVMMPGPALRGPLRHGNATAAPAAAGEEPVYSQLLALSDALSSIRPPPPGRSRAGGAWGWPWARARRPTA